MPHSLGRSTSNAKPHPPLTSPGLMSLRALRWSRKLLSGKDASAFGMQLWLPWGQSTWLEVTFWCLHAYKNVCVRKKKKKKKNCSKTPPKPNKSTLSLHELWRRNRPDPSQLRKSPVSVRRARRNDTLWKAFHPPNLFHISPRQYIDFECHMGILSSECFNPFTLTAQWCVHVCVCSLYLKEKVTFIDVLV